MNRSMLEILMPDRPMLNRSIPDYIRWRGCLGAGGAPHGKRNHSALASEARGSTLHRAREHEDELVAEWRELPALALPPLRRRIREGAHVVALRSPNLAQS